MPSAGVCEFNDPSIPISNPDITTHVRPSPAMLMIGLPPIGSLRPEFDLFNLVPLSKERQKQPI